MSKRISSTEYEKFDSTMRELIKIPHSVIKAKLDAEKRVKQRRTQRKPRTSAVGRASRERG